MRAHIVGGGFGGLAAAGYLIENAGVSGQNITIYEAEERMGGGLPLYGNPQSGYVLPAGSVFDAEFRCTFELLAKIPSTRNPAVSVRDEFFTFNAQHPFNNRSRLIDGDLRIMHGPRFGLSLLDGFDLLRLVLTSEAKLEGRRIDEFFSQKFFATEFWLIYSTIMGSLPQHSAAELRRYFNRTLHLFPALSDMAGILRTPIDQYEAFIVPLVDWLREKGVNFHSRSFIKDIGLVPLPGRITVDRLDYERDGVPISVPVELEDLVLVSVGSQAADLAIGSMNEPVRPTRKGRSWEIWRRLAEGSAAFGRPDVFFGENRVSDSHWVTFTVTTTGTEFIDEMFALTSSEAGRGGLVSLIGSNWMLSLSIFHQPEIIGQPEGTHLWWGYGLFPERMGNFINKRMDECTGAEILEEVLRNLRFNAQFDAIMTSSICIPCDLPYANNIWLPRKGTDRPRPVPEGSTNLGLFGQYVEVPRDVAFTVEYSARAAWEAIQILTKRGPSPPPVYQAQYDLKALWGALKIFLFPGATRP
ncbi:oleate hydratase [Rhizobium ruizarguesonis]|uniref:Oleate hydratase n=1 Tax=Rhizobium ruizarguesonis TaxID=2081791 RepID=A0ABY1WY95_9HYPH|nr:oleate hydratase [Rhizobium ruizarguesonis]TAU13173.1 oleate hydratase [Rhizobium ruizarguesonis]TAU58430.1 oleate hydratase [Rhizobium ruizarguesonis]TAV03198.1 oleate hydratase [Rhizobium ruizarguesonis]TAV19130.1 oleate hydratase [Rhizobium ruizarguesonis]TAV20319.1 oleate hydratase [Rhizobium ruizarguesonis]